MAAAASSLIISSFSSKILDLPKLLASSLSPSPNPPTLTLKKPLSLSCVSFPLLPQPTPSTFRSLLVTNVAISSEYGEQQQGEEDEEEEAVNFPPELKVFVGNLPFSVDSSELAGLFVRAGNVEMVEVIYDKTTGRSRGFGFVTMSTTEEVHAAVQQFNGYELDGRPLRVNSGPPPRRDDLPPRGFRVGGGAPAANRLHVGNLSWGVDDVALESLFSEQGKVLEARVVYDRESGRSRGFGFVTYSSAEEVDSAISTLDGVDLKGRPIRVSAAEAKPRRQF